MPDYSDCPTCCGTGIGLHGDPNISKCHRCNGKGYILSPEAQEEYDRAYDEFIDHKLGYYEGKMKRPWTPGPFRSSCRSDGYAMAQQSQHAVDDKMVNSPAYQEWLLRAVAPLTGTDTPNDVIKRQRKNWLSQEQIDRLNPAPNPTAWQKVMTWLSAPAGAILTILVLAAFIGGMWGLFAIWHMRGK